jgi:hypothetical protein
MDANVRGEAVSVTLPDTVRTPLSSLSSYRRSTKAKISNRSSTVSKLSFAVSVGRRFLWMMIPPMEQLSLCVRLHIENLTFESSAELVGEDLRVPVWKAYCPHQPPFLLCSTPIWQHDETILPRMLECLKKGHLDIVIASRYAEGGT